MKQEEKDEETDFLKEGFNTEQKKIVNIKLGYVTKVLSIINSWFEGIKISDDPSYRLRLGYWFDDIKKIMIDNIFFEGDSRFLSEKEVGMIFKSNVLKNKLNLLHEQISKLFKRIELLEGIHKIVKDPLIRILSFNLWYKQP